MAAATRAGWAPRDWSFILKLVTTLALAAVAEELFLFEEIGAPLGGFALVLVAAVALLRPLRGRGQRVALAAAVFFALTLIYDPGPLAFLLYWTMLTLAVLLGRESRFDDGRRWILRLAAHGLLSPFGPIRDLIVMRRAHHRRGARLAAAALALALPIVGSLVFLGLFAAANPLIENVLLRIDARIAQEVPPRAIFAAFVAIGVWSLLRPPRYRLEPKLGFDDPRLGLTPATAIGSLAAFNLVFALQNGLDLAFLWTGAALPDGMGFAEYAHRGAYPLIVTALLAGLFVLIALRTGSATASSRAVRLLLVLWIAQNVLLVASTMLRTFDYIEAYSLTRMRIAALLWMGLVALGLILIGWRLLRGRSAAWLINANLLAALLVLAGSTLVDLGSVAAAWNVRHAREIGGRGVPLDLCYLNALGGSGLLPLLELESRPTLPPALRDRVRWLRMREMEGLARRQADWHGWTVRGAMRLAEARAVLAGRRLPAGAPDPAPRRCDGAPGPPAPLTALPDRTMTNRQ